MSNHVRMTKAESCEVLGIDMATLSEDPADEEANVAIATKAYRRLAMKWHPDKHANRGEEAVHEATEKFKEIGNAYSSFTNPEEPEMTEEEVFDMYAEMFAHVAELFGGGRGPGVFVFSGGLGGFFDDGDGPSDYDDYDDAGDDDYEDGVEHLFGGPSSFKAGRGGPRKLSKEQQERKAKREEQDKKMDAAMARLHAKRVAAAKEARAKEREKERQRAEAREAAERSEIALRREQAIAAEKARETKGRSAKLSKAEVKRQRKEKELLRFLGGGGGSDSHVDFSSPAPPTTPPVSTPPPSASQSRRRGNDNVDKDVPPPTPSADPHARKQLSARQANKGRSKAPAEPQMQRKPKAAKGAGKGQISIGGKPGSGLKPPRPSKTTLPPLTPPQSDSDADADDDADDDLSFAASMLRASTGVKGGKGRR